MIAVPPSTPKAPKFDTVNVLPRRSASVDGAVACGAGEPLQVGRDVRQRLGLRVANHRDHETAVRLHRDPEMDRVEGDDLVRLRCRSAR